MERQRLPDKLEGFRMRNTNNHGYRNKDIYRLLYEPEMYIIAYNNIKANDGAETAGADGTSLHGFSQAWVEGIIAAMRDESYQPLPNKIQWIPKSNGKMRKLSFPNGKDKLVQEAVRIILECIYEPTFSDKSYGFRPGRSVQGAIAEIETWRGTVWFIEGDITACFDEIDHRILENILRERIDDERFIRLINKLLKAGYFDMHHGSQKNTSGTAQGSTSSPILCNIYLDKLDRYMEMVIERDTRGKRRKANPAYDQAKYQYRKAQSAGVNPKMLKALKQAQQALPSGDPGDPDFRRIHYVRYADDWLVGIIGPKSYAKALKEEIRVFLWERLRLRLSDEKTTITHARKEKASFLGYYIKKGYPHRPFDAAIRIFMNVDGLLKKLAANGFCRKNGYPMGVARLQNKPVEEIILYGGQVLRGLLYQQQGCADFYKGGRIQYIIQFSMAKTLARKLDTSMKKIFKRYGKALEVSYVNAKGKERTRKLPLFSTFSRQRDFFQNTKAGTEDEAGVVLQTRNPLAAHCFICKTLSQAVSMFHRRTKRKLDEPYQPIIKLMLQANRRQIPLCPECFKRATNNSIHLNQLLRRTPI